MEVSASIVLHLPRMKNSSLVWFVTMILVSDISTSGFNLHLFDSPKLASEQFLLFTQDTTHDIFDGAVHSTVATFETLNGVKLVNTKAWICDDARTIDPHKMMRYGTYLI